MHAPVYDLCQLGAPWCFIHVYFYIHVYMCIFSAPEPKVQLHYCDHALSVVCRPSSLTFHIFNLYSETAERNSTKLDRKQDLNVLYHVCVFRDDRENKLDTPASDRLRHFRLLLWNRWTEFNETWQEARSQRPLSSLCFSDRSKKKNKINAPASDWLRHFRLILWNRWTEFNETWQEARSQRPLPSLCFWTDRKNKMAALASDWWRRHYRDTWLYSSPTN